jgi:hypothetical protein
MDAASVKKLFGKMFIFSACFEGWMQRLFSTMAVTTGGWRAIAVIVRCRRGSSESVALATPGSLM